MDTFMENNKDGRANEEGGFRQSGLVSRRFGPGMWEARANFLAVPGAGAQIDWAWSSFFGDRSPEEEGDTGCERNKWLLPHSSTRDSDDGLRAAA